MRAQKILTVCMLVLFIAGLIQPPRLSAQSSSAGSGSDLPEYRPYATDEFSPWMVSLRRAESIFFGSLPVTYSAAALVQALLVPSGYPTGSDGFLLNLSIAAGVSAGIALLDYIIGELSHGD